MSTATFWEYLLLTIVWLWAFRGISKHLFLAFATPRNTFGELLHLLFGGLYFICQTLFPLSLVVAFFGLLFELGRLVVGFFA